MTPEQILSGLQRVQDAVAGAQRNLYTCKLQWDELERSLAQLPSMIEAAERLEAQPCPFVVSSKEGTSFCRLAEAQAKPLDLESEELRQFVAESIARARCQSQLPRRLLSVDYAQPCPDDTRAARVALLSIREFHAKPGPVTTGNLKATPLSELGGEEGV